MRKSGRRGRKKTWRCDGQKQREIRWIQNDEDEDDDKHEGEDCSPHFIEETTEAQRGYSKVKSLVSLRPVLTEQAIPSSSCPRPANQLRSLKQVLTEFSGGAVLSQP